MKLLSFLILVSPLCYSKTTKDVDVEYYKKYIEETLISKVYRKGKSLIYDCTNLHYACVSDDSLEACLEPGCLRIKTFKDQPECFKEHKRVMSKTSITRFCKN